MSGRHGSMAREGDRGDFPVQVAALDKFTRELLMRYSVPAGIASGVADSLIEADLEGIPSHGLALLPLYLRRITAGSVSPDKDGRVVSDAGGAMVIDAENGLGQASSAHAVRLAVECARKHGLGAVAVRNGFHFGTAGRWARAMAREGCIGVALSNTRPLMPAPGGAERVVGNNPVAVAVPCAGSDPLTVDFALSAAAMGKIRLADAEGRTLPEGWAADVDGVPTTDPEAAIAGMLLPAAGPKGFGLALMVEFLTGGLSSGAVGDGVNPLYGDPATPYRCSHFFLAVHVEAFRPQREFAAVAARFADRIRTSRPAPGTDKVRVPGDGAAGKRRSARGECSLSSTTVATLRALGDKHSIAFPAIIE